jgi:hypothetical protein
LLISFQSDLFQKTFPDYKIGKLKGGIGMSKETRANVEEVAQLMLPLQAAFDQNPVNFSR